jgi:hypothetical protein
MEQRTVKLQNLEGALEEIGVADGAARLPLHLLSMEAQQRKEEIGAHLDRLEQKLDRGLQKALAGATDRARQLTKSVQEFLRPPSLSRGLGAAPRRPVHDRDATHLCRQRRTDPERPRSWDGDCGAVPGVDAEGNLCGILTDRDLCTAAAPLIWISCRRAITHARPGKTEAQRLRSGAADPVTIIPPAMALGLTRVAETQHRAGKVLPLC